ncbi:DASH complex, subunit Dam1 [Cordyceps javanica]|nr:DASH complex, subunit Dam1 [Cordyceps javanica]
MINGGTYAFSLPGVERVITLPQPSFLRNHRPFYTKKNPPDSARHLSKANRRSRTSYIFSCTRSCISCAHKHTSLKMTFEEAGPNVKRSGSRPRTPRPTTPLRPSSRSSFRDSARAAGNGDAPFPLNAFEPAFAELSDAMTDLEANMMHFQLMHESLTRFSESFASFLYGLNMNAFCVDFPEVL